MSYCRFGDADIYVFGSMNAFECCGCPSGKSFSTKSAAEMICHMKAHRDAGLEVPDYAFAGVFADRNDYRTAQWSTWSPDSVAQLPTTEWGTDYWGDILSEPSEGHARGVARITGATLYRRAPMGTWVATL